MFFRFNYWKIREFLHERQRVLIGRNVCDAENEKLGVPIGAECWCSLRLFLQFKRIKTFDDL